MFLTYMKLRTQKSQGLSMWHTLAFGTLSGLGVFNNPDGVLVSVWPHDPIPNQERYPLFGRPCPVTPRHGFVDSKRVYTYAGAVEMTEATIAEDSDGEVMFMPVLSGKFSAVVNNAGVTWGRGNAGATGGDNGAVTIPAYTGAKRWNRVIGPIVSGYGRVCLDFLEGISGGETSLFLELVENSGGIELVQARTGPATGGDGDKDWVPETMRVERVITVKSGDGGPFTLLEWEQVIHKSAPGTVFLFRGGSLASHYSIHAITNGIPVICSRRRVEVGMELKARKNGVRLPTPTQLRTFSDCLHYYHKKRWRGYWKNIARFTSEDYERSCKEMALLGVGIAHASSLWGWERALIELRAAGIIGTIRLILIACIGEGRHFYGNGPGKWNVVREHEKVESCVPWNWLYSGQECRSMTLYDPDECSNLPTRDSTYETLLQLKLEDVVALGRMVEVDLALDWKSNSFGGQKWLWACQSALKLYGAMAKFCETPSKASLTTLMEQLNITIHTVHNGGAVLSKWISQTNFNLISGKIGAGEVGATESPVLPLAFMSNLVGGIVTHDFKNYPKIAMTFPARNSSIIDMKLAISADLEHLKEGFK